MAAIRALLAAQVHTLQTVTVPSVRQDGTVWNQGLRKSRSVPTALQASIGGPLHFFLLLAQALVLLGNTRLRGLQLVQTALQEL